MKNKLESLFVPYEQAKELKELTEIVKNGK
jgi:hypothetical protein